MAKTKRRTRTGNKTLKNVADLWKDGSVGEGRSKTIYIPPQRTDTAVLIPFFNPAPFKRPLKNLLYIVSCMRAKGIPCFVAECIFFDRAPEIPDADLHVRSNSIMFYKEQLINKLEAKVPAQYTKLVIIDSDVIFSAPDWLDQISHKLDSVEVVQPYSTACWLYPDNTRIRAKKPSYGYALSHNLPREPPNAYHPGFAWAIQRELFRKIGGFYDKAIAGNGDIMFVFSLMDNIAPLYLARYAPCTLDTWKEWNAKVQAIKPSVSYLTMDVYHLFHGLRRNRQYASRHDILNEALQDGWDTVIEVNEDGMYEFKDPKFSGELLQYFRDREEDVPLEVAMLPP